MTLAFPDIKLQHTWRIDELPWSAFAHDSKFKSHHERISALDTDLQQALQPFVDAVSPSYPETVRSVHRAAALCFLYVLLSLSMPEMPSTLYTLRSTIPIGAGLGSSASISVCLAAAVLHQNKRLNVPHAEQSDAGREEVLELINRWAFVGELCIHGNPSGIDNTVATKGKAVLFRRTKPGQPPEVTSLHDFPVLPLLLVDTKQSRSTAVEVAKVGKLKDEYPDITNLMLDAIGKVTESAHSMLGSAGFDSKDESLLHRLGALVRINHGLLVALGVSHPRLERIRELVDHEDIGYTKLTGAGGGGCAITVLKPGVAHEVLQKLEADLEKEGFAKYETLLGGAGVGILEPAEVAGRSISQAEMLKVADSEGIEKLLGASTSSADSGWTFWTT